MFLSLFLSKKRKKKKEERKLSKCGFLSLISNTINTKRYNPQGEHVLQAGHPGLEPQTAGSLTVTGCVFTSNLRGFSEPQSPRLHDQARNN